VTTLRPEAPADFDDVDRVVRTAFSSDWEVALVHAIRDGDGYIPELALVATTAGGRLIGHVMISHAFLVDAGKDHRIATLSPLAVEPEWQRRGIGSDLVRRVTIRAAEMGEPAVVLEGSPDYYHRFGFEPSKPHGIHIDLPDWAPAEAAQVLWLSAVDPVLKGRLDFPALNRTRPGSQDLDH
jgi:putative acetyltransferase